MFVVIYEMTVKSGYEERFEKAWAQVTDLTYKHRGSLGSRLHKTGYENMYIAYAQWPTREIYVEQSETPHRSEEERLARQAMFETLQTVTRLHYLEVVDDRTHSTKA